MIGKPDEDMKASAEYTEQARAMRKPLFIPLKTEYFEAFKAGTKKNEYRVYGPRWNERTCPVGRPVVLSKGYGKAHRLHGRVVEFWQSSVVPDSWEKVYGPQNGRTAACIKIKLNADSITAPTSDR